MTLLPPGLPVLTTLGAVPEAQAWLAALPRLIAEVAAHWELRLSPPLSGGSCSWVAPVTRPGGTAAIVKISWPHREMYGEPAALRHWAGRGAVRLLAHDPSRHALLLERCSPGTELRAWPGDQLTPGCAVLRRLHNTPSPASPHPPLYPPSPYPTPDPTSPYPNPASPGPASLGLNPGTPGPAAPDSGASSPGVTSADAFSLGVAPAGLTPPSASGSDTGTPGASGSDAGGEVASGGNGVETLAVVAAEWAELLEERMDRLRPGYDPGLVAAGADFLRTLPGSAGREVLLHGDFNPGNVLAHDEALAGRGLSPGDLPSPGLSPGDLLAHRSLNPGGSLSNRGLSPGDLAPCGLEPGDVGAGAGWLAIDPKPMLGDPAYDPWPLVEQVVDGRTRRERYAVAAAELGLDADRVRAWAVARIVESALWSASLGDVDGGAAELRNVREIAP